ncbi:MAG TPA: VWA domain-containing protein, partial [Vineibacter sp.]|nr:VWA domain-containing protein [Vineibacter sp.]
MSEPVTIATAPLKPEGKLVANIMNFGRALRAAGLPIGPGRVIEAVRAVEASGLQRREDLYWTLFSVLVNRRDQREIFDQAFHIFWRNPRLLEKMMGLMLPQVDTGEPPESQKQLSRRLQEALQPGSGESPDDAEEPPKVELEATLTFSDRELLQKKDFEQMSAAEIAQAMKAIRRLTLPIREARTRRTAPAPHGPRVDMRATFR